LTAWNDAGAELPGRGIPELFEEQVRKAPQTLALSFGEERLSYAELNRRANRLAWHLRELGIGPGTPVGLCLGRSAELIVATLAVLKAGGAYVPLDLSYPEDRLAFML